MEVSLSRFQDLFVSRDDLYAQASSDEGAGVRYGPRHLPLDKYVLKDHLDGLFSVGSYLVRPVDNLARVVVLDVDDDSKEIVQKLVWNALNAGLPEQCLVVEKTGGRGWHLWVLFKDWVPAVRARNLGNFIAAKMNKVEVFPKGVELPEEGFGTLVRLPLGLHPRTGHPSELFNAKFEPIKSLDEIDPIAEDLVPKVRSESTKKAPALTRRGVPCIQILEKGISHGERDRGLFAISCYYRDMGASEEIVEAILHDVNSRCIPPVEPGIISQKVSSAFKTGAVATCSNEILAKYCQKEICRFRGRKNIEIKARRSWDATDLMNEDLPPLHWVVDEMLPQGFGLVAGKPKLGKSWFCLDLAISVALGREFLGHITRKSPVLYLALEDGEARLQDRLKKLQCPDGLPLQIEFDFPRFGSDSEGLLLLEQHLSEGHSSGEPYGLVVIDSFSAAKNTKSEELSPEDMEEVVRPLQALGNSYRCLILIIHHHRKSATGDVIWDSRGSGALVAVADVALGIYEDKGTFHLVSRSRDTPELSYWLVFDSGKFTLQGTEESLGSNDSQRLIVRMAETFPFVTARHISGVQGISIQAAHTLLRRMTEKGFLISEMRGSEKIWTLAAAALEIVNTYDFGE